MSLERVMNAIGLGLLGLCFVLALGRVFTREAPVSDGGSVTLRFAHWQLEGGVRAAFDAVAREYENLHPGVKLEQMAIPERIARNWSKTQLVGGTAPDIIQLGDVMAIMDEERARYFLPLTPWIAKPNPYNAGTDLEGVPWRDTFIDGLEAGENYSATLLDYFGVPSSMFSLRVYYNRDLYLRITGGDKPPADYREFLDLCRKAADFQLPDGGHLLPIAGSKYNAPWMMNDLFQSQTQRLALELDANRDLRADAAELAAASLLGWWKWSDPPVRAGFELMNEVGRRMQPGFLSLGRDDALFSFVQGRALMIATGSWDATSIRVQAPFEIGVFKIPIPAAGDPDYGRHVLGPLTELGSQTGLSFGVVRREGRNDLAVDFLHFLTSKASNAKFSAGSGWLPSVLGVVPPEQVLPFMPLQSGFPGGFTPDLNGLGAEIVRVQNTLLYRLVGPGGNVDAYINELSGQSGPAIRYDLDKSLDNARRNFLIKDTTLIAYRELATGAGGGWAGAKFLEVLESQDEQERWFYRTSATLSAIDAGGDGKEGR